VADDEAVSVSRRKWVRWGWFGSAILLPALFAGLFSLIPNLFDRLMAPKAKLEYNIASSPSINTGGNNKSIYSLSLLNSGGAKLTNIVAKITLPRGAVEQANIDISSGEQPRLVPINNGSEVYISSLFPGERSTATFLVAAPTPGVRIDVKVRSSEVLGKASEPSDKKEQPVPPWFALFPAFGVVIASLMSVTLFRNSRIAKLVGFPISPTLSGLDRDDVIGLIATYVDLPELDAAFVFRAAEVTYLRFSEVLVRIAIKSDEEVRSRCVAGLKCLALSPHMNERSHAVVLKNVSWIDPTADVANLNALRDTIRTMMEFRREARLIFRLPPT